MRHHLRRSQPLSLRHLPADRLQLVPAQFRGHPRTVQNITYQLTEPVLGPLRRIIPPVRLGGAAIDLSALILILGYLLLIRPLIGC